MNSHLRCLCLLHLRDIFMNLIFPFTNQAGDLCPLLTTRGQNPVNCDNPWALLVKRQKIMKSSLWENSRKIPGYLGKVSRTSMKVSSLQKNQNHLKNINSKTSHLHQVPGESLSSPRLGKHEESSNREGVQPVSSRYPHPNRASWLLWACLQNSNDARRFSRVSPEGTCGQYEQASPRGTESPWSTGEKTGECVR